MKLLRLMFLLIFLFPVGCNDDDCGSDVPRYLDVTKLTGRSVQLLTDNYHDVDSLAAQARVSFEQYALQLFPTVEFTNQRAEVTGRWGSAAYACDPVPPQPFESVVDIAVFSNAAYQQASSDVIAAGERLNSIVKIYDYYRDRIVGLPDFLMDRQFASDFGFLLQFTTAPAQATTHAFTVRYVLDNGERYEFNAPPVTITP